ncbi:MAG: response regulator, partial [Patescibacteria group bacterium]
YKVVQSIDGEGAIRLINDERPNLVLLDLILPGIDGFEVLRQKKENQELTSIPVIILSNLGQKEEIDKGLALGASDFVIKAHFTPGEIVEKIKSFLGK